jgi:hypothetical protein
MGVEKEEEKKKKRKPQYIQVMQLAHYQNQQNKTEPFRKPSVISNHFIRACPVP